MEKTTLTSEKCLPCEGGVSPLTREDARPLMNDVLGWDLRDDAKEISRTVKRKDFVDALAFVSAVGAIAEEEGHHPDIDIRYSRVTLRLSTHAIKGLSRNDFILAAKINALLDSDKN
ncbi:MAG: 4a-hydroxytetrahydrobiopterin dehydratase [Candidatus Peregrinibacteria bacterium]|nr:4a-hydroxytetrahydrobiopterin dehydratase [Candidatus Peregrinibacteria bacterium]